MCTFSRELEIVCDKLLEKDEAFDALQVRNQIRELVGPDIPILYLPVKYELLAYFERGGLPGFVIGTKSIGPQSVFEFRPEPKKDPVKVFFSQMALERVDDYDDYSSEEEPTYWKSRLAGSVYGRKRQAAAAAI